MNYYSHEVDPGVITILYIFKVSLVLIITHCWASVTLGIQPPLPAQSSVNKGDDPVPIDEYSLTPIKDILKRYSFGIVQIELP